MTLKFVVSAEEALQKAREAEKSVSGLMARAEAGKAEKKAAQDSLVQQAKQDLKAEAVAAVEKELKTLKDQFLSAGGSEKEWAAELPTFRREILLRRAAQGKAEQQNRMRNLIRGGMNRGPG